MKQTINFSQFCDAFRAHDRQDQFSYEGLGLLFDYLEQYEEETGEQIELDVVALCCDYAEMEYDDIVFAYDLNLKIDDFDEMDECEQHKAIEEWLNDWTTLVGATSDGALVFAQNF